MCRGHMGGIQRAVGFKVSSDEEFGTRGHPSRVW